MRQLSERLSARRRAAGGLVLAAAALLTVGFGPAAQAGDIEGPIPEEFRVAKVLPPIKCARAAEEAGWTGMDLVLTTAIALAESGCDPKATGISPPTEGCPDGSRDRGAWQINDCYHPDVDDRCAYNLQCSAHAAYDIYLDWGNFRAWVTYNERLFKYYLTEARKAVKQLTGQNIVLGVVVTEGGPLNVRNKPRTSGDLVGTLDNGAIVRLRCQTKGQSIYSPIFGYETRVWDSDGRDRYFSDAYVHTDSRTMVAPRC